MRKLATILMILSAFASVLTPTFVHADWLYENQLDIYEHGSAYDHNYNYADWKSSTNYLYTPKTVLDQNKYSFEIQSIIYYKCAEDIFGILTNRPTLYREGFNTFEARFNDSEETIRAQLRIKRDSSTGPSLARMVFIEGTDFEKQFKELVLNDKLDYIQVTHMIGNEEYVAEYDTSGFSRKLCDDPDKTSDKKSKRLDY